MLCLFSGLTTATFGRGTPPPGPCSELDPSELSYTMRCYLGGPLHCIDRRFSLSFDSPYPPWESFPLHLLILLALLIEIPPAIHPIFSGISLQSARNADRSPDPRPPGLLTLDPHRTAPPWPAPPLGPVSFPFPLQIPGQLRCLGHGRQAARRRAGAARDAPATHHYC